MEKEKFDEIMKELRSTQDQLKSDREALEAEKRALDQERAQYASNPAVQHNQVLGEQLRNIITAMKEKRAIVLNGAGAVEVIGALFKVFRNRTSILDGLRYFYGPNASTKIPVLTARPARPARVAEGVTNASGDSTAALGNTSLDPETHFSELAVSFESLQYLPFDFEAQLREIFGDAFADDMANQVVNGRGKTTYYEFEGLFSSVPSGNKIECAAAGAPTIVDIVKLALAMQTKVMVNPTIVISPTLYAGITTAEVKGYEVYKNELILNRTIEGVRIEVCGYAPTATSANSIVAVGFDKGDYAVGVAVDLTIRPVTKTGDTNTYYQAMMGLDGKPICANNVFGLKAISG